ncbi:hypothetical protein NRB_34220 [Novosphingobium sp. 11B]
MIVRSILHRPLGKALIGLAGLFSLAGCSQPPAPAPTESTAEDAAAAAKARAKAEREAKLAAFYGGDAPAIEQAPKKDDGPGNSPPPPAAPPPSAPSIGSALAAPDPGIGKVE